MQWKIPAVYMRGGTSKGLFFHRHHLPQEEVLRDLVILAAYGSPDPSGRQPDGLGGGTSVTNKVAIIGPSKSPGHHVDYLFGQVSVDRPQVSYKGSCGNMCAAVGPFVLEEGLVAAEEPVTVVRIYQVNTGKTILAEVPVRDGSYDPHGDYKIDGVPGTGSRINLRFLNPEGSMTGALLPTGRERDVLEVRGLGEVEVSIVDAGNPVVFVKACDLGLEGKEIDRLEKDQELKARIESIRGEAAVVLGMVESPQEAARWLQSVPKIALVSAACDYRSLSGRLITEGETDLSVRMMSMGGLHKALAVTVAICTAGAVMIPGTLVHEVARKDRTEGRKVRIGHPSGVLEIEAFLEKDAGSYKYREAVVGRTARRLMEGFVCVPKRLMERSP